MSVNCKWIPALERLSKGLSSVLRRGQNSSDVIDYYCERVLVYETFPVNVERLPAPLFSFDETTKSTQTQNIFTQLRLQQALINVCITGSKKAVLRKIRQKSQPRCLFLSDLQY